jgi:hypothetical protein
MPRTHLNIPNSAAGRMTEIVTKAGRADKDSDVLMRTKIVEDKSGELKAVFRGITTSSFGAELKNWLLGRSPADKTHVLLIFKNAGMSDAQAREALHHVSHVGAHFSAKSVKTAVSKFHAAQHQEKIANKNFSAEDGKLLTKNQMDFREADLKYALLYPIENHTGTK